MEDEIKTIKVKGEVWKKLLMLKYEWEMDKVSDVVERIMINGGYLGEKEK